MKKDDHSIRMFALCSMALSLISLILMFYGAWLFDQQLATKVQVFTSMSIPLAGSIICAIIASLKNWRN